MAKKKTKVVDPAQIAMELAADPFIKPVNIEDEFPREKKLVPVIISKIVTCKEREIYVIRVHCIGSKVLKESPKFVYSSWEIPKTGSKYAVYTDLNGFKLGKIDTEYTERGEDSTDYSQYAKELAYEAISLASPEAYKFGKKANGSIHLRLKES